LDSKVHNILLKISGGGALLTTIVCFPFVSPALRRVCLPYVPATDSQVRNVFSALTGRSGKLVDLGSGDGRIVSFVLSFWKSRNVHLLRFGVIL